jgi:hypothetical protein
VATSEEVVVGGGRAIRNRSGLDVLSLVVVIGLALWVSHLQMTFTPLMRDERSSLVHALDGTSARPFCYRVLVPWAAVAVGAVIPPVVGDRLCREPTRWLGCDFIPERAHGPGPYLGLALLQFLSILTFALVLGRTYRRVFAASRGKGRVISAVALLFIAVVIRFGYCGHLYDFPVLALFAGMLWALLFSRLTVFLLLFGVACWTKETAILMTFAYCAIFFDRLPRRRFLGYLALQVLAYAVAQIVLRWWFRDHAGSPIEAWYAEQLPWFGRKTGLKVALLGLGLLWMSIAWSLKPVAVRRALFMVLPHLALFAYGGRPGEARALYESFPVLMLVLFSSSVQVWSLVSLRAARLLGASSS